MAGRNPFWETKMSEHTTLRIEIRPEEPVPGQTEVSKGPPGSVRPDQLMRLISQRNVSLLRLIKTSRPQSLAELSRLSGRPKASLTRTMQRLSALGIVVMRKAGGRGKVPAVACDRLQFDLDIGIDSNDGRQAAARINAKCAS